MLKDSKRFISVILATLTLAALPSCGETGVPGADSADASKETAASETVDYSKNILFDELTFGYGGTAAPVEGEGTFTVVSGDDILEITYAESTTLGHKYLARFAPLDTKTVNINNFYVRMLYSADIKGDASRARISLYDDGTGASTQLVKGVKDTEGRFVLSDTGVVTYEFMSRFTGNNTQKTNTNPNTIAISDSSPDSVYRIKALYFFSSEEDADAFTYSGGDAVLTIAGNPIEKYSIVTEKDPSVTALNCANKLRKRIRDLTGYNLPIITDREPATEYEILVGRSSRELSHYGLREVENNVNKHCSGYCALKDSTVVFTSFVPMTLERLTDGFIDDYLYGKKINVPDVIELDDVLGSVYYESATKYSEWSPVVNVSDPEVLTFDFSSDTEHFTEDNGRNDFMIADGTLSCGEVDNAHTFIHIFEKNTEASARISVTDCADGARFGLTARHTAEQAFIKAGYDVLTNEWFIEEREGVDFYKSNTAKKADTELKADTVYELSLKVNGDYAILCVDGTEVLRAKVAQTTPGKVGIFAENCGISADDYSVALLSGQGTAIRGLTHTKLPDDRYLEGGTVYVMDDGTLQYQNHHGVAYTSSDNGVTWQKSEMFTTMSGYSNMIRLNNGEWLKMVRSGGAWISQTSKDGVEWTDGGVVCQTPYPGTAAGAGNMNDKLFQSATTGRIFYGQNYETTTDPVDGKMVFCEFYYSDDNGATWTKSETDSWELVGNENETHFGECKMLECADGSIRMYNSWNRHGCIVYSESFDNGVTFGPLVRMEEFICPTSSMQFVRDPYADNDTTYYMVWVYGPIDSKNVGMNRSRLALARSTDGKNWDYLGDIWRWENNWMAPRSRALISHIVDPFIQVTEDYIICGSGFSEQIAKDESGDSSYHQAQRQHIYSIKKEYLTAKPLPSVK